MLIAAVVTLCAAVLTAGLGLWSLVRPRAGDSVAQIMRAVAPTQLAAAVMLAAGGTVALAAAPEPGLALLVGCVGGAVGTVAAGCYQSAKALSAVASQPAASCTGTCASCTLSCG